MSKHPLPAPQGAGKQPYTTKDRIVIQADLIPAFRTSIALQNKTANNLLIKTWGGLGDQVCAEPTLRNAVKTFDTCNVSLASEHPELFAHLNMKKVFNLKDVQPNYDKYLVFDTIVNSDHLVWQFFSHCLTNCVDFPSLCAFRMTLPIQDKEIILSEQAPTHPTLTALTFDKTAVYIHAGKHWPSKTFPKDWWDGVITGLLGAGFTPVLIGANTDDNRGTVDVETKGCIDLRNKTSLLELSWLLHRAKVLLTNDSSPLHFAASRAPHQAFNPAWIGYIATCKHPDYISHWRRDDMGKMTWNWREENLGLDGLWNHLSNCPNQENEVKVDEVDEATLRTWLPDFRDVVKWTTEKMKSV